MPEADQDKTGLDRPFMSDVEIEAIASSLRLFHGPVNVLEWGSGGSTLFFSAMLRVGSRWVSLEHDGKWAEKVRTAIHEARSGGVQLHHVPNTEPLMPGDDGEYDGFRDYILFPTTLREKFDVILVDGRARVECMQIGWMVLRRSGIMILHDAQRIRYRRGIPADCSYVRIANPKIYIDDGDMSVLFMGKSAGVIALLADMLRRRTPDDIRLEFDESTARTIERKVSWSDVVARPVVRLYAGDIPYYAEYEGVIGLSPSVSDYRHIRHDIATPFPVPDCSIDAFQAEDVFEHITYESLVPVIDEIFRILKPNGLFRLSLPDYGCDVLRERSHTNAEGVIVFDPGGGGTLEAPGHVWFPDVHSVKSLLERTRFAREGRIDYLHWYNADKSFTVRPIDYAFGYVLRTPDNDPRVMHPYRPLSMVIDLVKLRESQ